MSLSRLVYDLFIRVYVTLIRLAALFNPKARLWLQGRKDWRRRLREKISSGGVDLWIHCASLGEFEQGRPVIEALRKAHPSVRILLTFFSPSGYEVRKDYALCDHVCYLPLDTVRNARDFLDIVKPRAVIFVKYEFWLHFITELYQRAKPVVLVSAIFRQDQFFFRWYGRGFLPVLSYYERIFVQDERSRQILEAHRLTRVTVAGDTRFDRVGKIAAEAREVEGMKTFLGNARTIVAGSTWPGDDEAILPCLAMADKWVIAPHEVNESRLRQLEKRLPADTVRYSRMVEDPEASRASKVLVIDNIGMLSALYRYGRIAIIGGGFDHGIHNVLEAAVYGIPVLFGPKYQKFREARDLIAVGGAFTAEGPGGFAEVLGKLAAESFAANAGRVAGAYVLEQSGATGKILDFLQQKRFLTNA